MGFFLGADPEVSFTVLRNVPALKARYRLPVLISVSRKGFLRKLTGQKVEKIGPATLAAELGAVALGADMIRTHEPGAIRDALTILPHIAPGLLSQIAANR
jgi:dihydropteroate synthase type 2